MLYTTMREMYKHLSSILFVAVEMSKFRSSGRLFLPVIRSQATGFAFDKVQSRPFICTANAHGQCSPMKYTVSISEKTVLSSFCRHPCPRDQICSPLKVLSNAEETYGGQHRNFSFQNKSIELLSSKSGSTVKLFASVATRKKARAKNKLTVVEGHRAVLDLLQQDKTRHLIKHVLITENALDSAALGSRLQEELGLSYNEGQPKNEFKINFVTDDVMKTCTDTVTPQGVVALCSIPSEWDPANSLNDNEKHSSLYLILDGVSDPGNVGTIFRSSLAVDVKGIFLLPNCVDVFSPKVVRSAMGCTFRVPVRHVDSVGECLSLLQQLCLVHPHRIFAATMDSSELETDKDTAQRSSPVYSTIQWADGPSALCIGKEGQGLSEEIREAVRRGDISSTHVPMANDLESLNAAVCASVIMFEYSRQVREQVDASQG